MLSGDAKIRAAAITRATALRARWGDAVPYSEIEKGFSADGKQLLLMSRAEGVFKPAAMASGVLSIRSTLASRYQDEPLSSASTYYEYSPKPGRNDWMRDSLAAGHDIIYFVQVKSKPGPEYAIFAPARIVADEPTSNRFVIDLAPSANLVYSVEALNLEPAPRLYESRTVQVRLFQAHFRRTVLAAYQNRCCVCSLPERPLLDGAHITPDAKEDGEPVITNGLAMCALHHRAYDTGIMDVDPDYRVVVSRENIDFPNDPANRILLDYAGRQIRLPADDSLWPDRDRLRAHRAG